MRGTAISDGSYGLTPEQQKRYSNLAVVAAMPVRNARKRTIAVLTASGVEDPDTLLNKEGQQEHLELAQSCARLLIDVLQKAGD